MKKEVTKEIFLAAEIANISQVYNGKRDFCRCGCGGNYIASSFMEKPRSVVNDKLVLQRLKKGKKLILSGAEFDCGKNYIDVKTGNDRTLTFYFDEIKK